MTDKERAIIMAYTGACMLEGEKLDAFYQYLAELYGRPVYTHEWLTLDIKEKSRPDFIRLCKEEQPELNCSEFSNNWIPCSDMLPEINKTVLFCDFDGDIYVGYRNKWRWRDSMDDVKDVVAWMPLPSPYQSEEESE